MGRTALLLCWWGWVLDEFDTLGDVALETINSSLEKLLFVLVGMTKDVLNLLCTVWLSYD